MDCGAQIRDCLKGVAWWGAPPEEVWPYDLDKGCGRPPDVTYEQAARSQRIRYERLDQSAAQLKSCLAQGLPFIFGMVAYERFLGYEVATTGVLALPQAGERQVGGLAALAVGYVDDRECFIVRNSQGSNWGIGGDFLLPFDYVLNLGLAADFWTVRTVE